MAKTTKSAKKTTAKKTTKKAPAKKTKAKPAAKAKAKTPRDPKALRKPQVRILQALCKSSKPLSRKQIAEKASVDLAMQNSYIGSHDDAIRAKNDKQMPSLRTLGFVKVEMIDLDDRNTHVYSVTAAGKKSLAALSKTN